MTDAHSFELGTDGPSAIVVGIDGSATSMRAGAYAAGLARRQRARLVAVYVGSVAPMCVTEPSAAAVLRMAHSEAFEQTAADLRHEAEEKAREHGISITCHRGALTCDPEFQTRAEVGVPRPPSR